MPGSGYVPWDLSWEASLCKHLSKPWEILKSVNRGDHVVNRHTRTNLSKWSCLLRSSPCGKLHSSTGLPMFQLFLDSYFGAVCGIYGPFVNRLDGGTCPFSRLHLLLDNAQQCFTDKAGEHETRRREPQMQISIFNRQWPQLSADVGLTVTYISGCITSLITIYLSIPHGLSLRYRSVLMYWYDVIVTVGVCISFTHKQRL